MGDGGGPLRCSFILRKAALLAATPSVIELRLLRVARSGSGAKDTREDATEGEGGGKAGGTESRDDDEEAETDIETFDTGLGRCKIPPVVPFGGAGQNLVFAGGSEASGGGLKCSRRVDIVSTDWG